MRIETSVPECILRPWNPADKADLLSNANNRKVWRNLAGMFPFPYTERDAHLWFDIAAAPGRSTNLAITLEGRAIGGIGAVACADIAQRTALFGYWLGEAHWGKGIASAAAAAFVRYLEAQGTFARLEAAVFEWNPASMRVLEKIGFEREGTLRKSVSKDGQLIDSVMYAYIMAD